MPPASANLHNSVSVSFPAFEDLPFKNDLNEDYYSMRSGGFYEAHRHWCLFAEIRSVQPWLRLVLSVQDAAGHEFLVSFNTEDKGESVMMQATPGYTVAMLYAEQHGFMSGHEGVRLEDPTQVKVGSTD